VSLHLPEKGHPYRELFDVADLARLSDPETHSKIPTVAESIASARVLFETMPGLKDVHYIVRTQRDGRTELILVRVSRMETGPGVGRWTRLWSFGHLPGL